LEIYIAASHLHNFGAIAQDRLKRFGSVRCQFFWLSLNLFRAIAYTYTYLLSALPYQQFS